MKLTLIRHGIAEDKNIGQSDWDRVLICDGRKKLLKSFEKNHDTLESIDMIVCSPSIRTRQTCFLLQSMIVLDPSRVSYDQRLYNFSADADKLHDVIQEYSIIGVQHLCIIGHNHSISALASHYAQCNIVMKKWAILHFDIV